MTLNPQQIRFLQRLAADKFSKARDSDVADFFCEHFHIGSRVGRTFEYIKSDRIKAQQMLTSRNLPLAPLPTGSLRAEAFRFPGITEKSGTQSPHSNSVAIKPIAGQCFYEGSRFWIAPESYAVLTIEQALAVTAQRLLVVENLETFRLLERYRWIDCQGLDVLAIYRGDPRFRTDEAEAVIKRRTEPTWLFADFDPAGLAMALGLPRLERMVLPDRPHLETMTIHSRRQDLYTNQVKQYGNLLDQQSSTLIGPAWNLMKRLGAGLPQEWMQVAQI